jgi:hypothetical protein
MPFSITALVPWFLSKFRDLFNKVLICNKDQGTGLGRSGKKSAQQMDGETLARVNVVIALSNL